MPRSDAYDANNADMDLIDDPDCQLMIMSLGAEVGPHRRERRTAARRMVSEVYSPPRVTRAISAMPSCGLVPGFALDLTCSDPDDGEPWDFDRSDKRSKARQLLRDQKPLVLVGSPMCTAWCTWQRLNALRRDGDLVRRELARARIHLDFVVSLYREQLEGGRYFLHEHPDGATSWQEDSIKSLLETPGVGRVTADQCQFGAEVNFGTLRGSPIRKRTGFMSNGEEILNALRSQCTGKEGRCSRRRGGHHALVSGKIARSAARYPPGLVKRIIRGIIAQLKDDGIMKDGEVGIHAVDDDASVARSMKGADQGYSGRYKDDLTKQPLKDVLVREAREKELKYFIDKGVWIKRPRQEAFAATGRPPISVRWVDVNKGDDENPKYRSRLVARQLKAMDKSGESFFAPTPPLEALRTIISLAATSIGRWRPCYDPSSERRTQIGMMDISRAYFNAKVDDGTHTYVQLPPEDSDHGVLCAKLLRHMYGTRAAADGWQEEYSSTLVSRLGFIQGVSSPCLFRHAEREIFITVHGDDFTSVGAKEDIDWFEESMKELYELTTQPRMGPAPEDAKEGLVLNRVLRWTDAGLEYEADPRQAEKLIGECGLTGSNTAATPGVRVSFDEVEKDEALEERLHTAFRASAARANYLAADRIDCQFAAKEVCRWMATPSRQSWLALKRLCRYLVGLPRLVYRYQWQSIEAINVYTDTDWAGCPRTRKSTSGGCVLAGTHTIKTWSSTQSSVSLSSGEAEFYGVVRGAGMGLGYQSLLKDLGHDLPVRVWTDSSASIGICTRQGLGKLRHIDTHTLWVQQAVRSGRVDLRKVAGEANPADLFTKHSLSRDRLMNLTALFDCEFRGGRAESAPQTRTAASAKTTMAEASSLASVEPTGGSGEGPGGSGEVGVSELGIAKAEGEHPLCMPHNVYSREEMDRLHPSFIAPPAVDADDPHDDAHEALLHEGYRLAGEIAREASVQGRRRQMR